MLVKNAENRGQLEFVSLENMVPQDHLLRKIEDVYKRQSVYEAQTAVMAQGGAWLSNHVYTKDEVRWEYRDGNQWKPVSEDKFPGFSYTVEAGKKQDDFQFTRTELTLPNVLDEWDGLRLSLIHIYGTMVTATGNGRSLLPAQPITIIHIKPITAWRMPRQPFIAREKSRKAWLPSTGLSRT